MNKDIIKEHFQEIFNHFKEIYFFERSKNKKIDYYTLLKNVLRTYELNLEVENFSEFQNWFNNVHSFHFITNLLNHDFEELIIHNEKNYFLKTHDQKTIFDLPSIDHSDYQKSIENFADQNNIDWNYANPFCSFDFEYLNQSFRITLIHSCLTENKTSKVFIRKHNENFQDIKYFTNDNEIQDLLKHITENKKNILIAGSTGSGKTTFLNALLNYIPTKEHTIIIEDTHELKLKSKNCTSLLANNSEKGKSLSDYCAYAMRMSPDRIIIGELRSKEVISLLLAMNSGHNGCLSTIHANNASDAINRLVLLFSIYATEINLDIKFVLELICKNIEYVIFIKNKQIIEIKKILGCDGMRPFFEQIYLNDNNTECPIERAS